MKIPFMYTRALTISCAAAACLFFSAPLASAGVGAEIGVSFPAGHSSAASGERIGYAACSYGQIAQELTVAERNGGIRLELTVTNTGDEAYTVAPNDGQYADFFVLDKNGKILYHWADEAAPEAKTENFTVASHQADTLRADIPRKAWKKIREDALVFTAVLHDAPCTLSTRLPQKAASSSSPVVIHGGVVIGSGHWLVDGQPSSDE